MKLKTVQIRDPLTLNSSTFAGNFHWPHLIINKMSASDIQVSYLLMSQHPHNSKYEQELPMVFYAL